MKKIPTVYLRDETNRAKVTDVVNPECQWVIDGEGVPTRKYDGTCVMLDEDGEWWARREVKPGKTPPANFVQVNFDDVTGRAMGWEPIEQSPFAKMHAEALGNPYERRHEGTYELCGPKVNGNPEKYDGHHLIAHGDAEIPNMHPGETVKEFVARQGEWGWEGVVWHWPQPDGTVRMAKLKVRDLP